MRALPTQIRQAVLVIAVAACLTACDSGQQAAPPPLTVMVAESERRDVPLQLEMVGSTLGNQDVPIRARPGRKSVLRCFICS